MRRTPTPEDDSTNCTVLIAHGTLPVKHRKNTNVTTSSLKSTGLSHVKAHLGGIGGNIVLHAAQHTCFPPEGELRKSLRVPGQRPGFG